MAVSHEKFRPYYKPVFMTGNAIGVVLLAVGRWHSNTPGGFADVLAHFIVDLPGALLAGWVLGALAESGRLTWWKR